MIILKSHYLLSMAVKIIDHGSKEYKQMVDLRYQMLRKPLGLSFTEKELAQEKNNIHIGLFDDDKLEGCCMLVPIDSTTLQLRQMAVTSGLQGKGMGRALMQFSENISRDRGYKKLIMHARKTAIGFYEKLGYSKTGNEFLEVTIPHYVMEKIL
jgi:predicted GNAT family N-acyltransferase